MGEFIDQYGTMIVEAMTGVILIGLLYMTLAAGSVALDTSFFDEGSYRTDMSSFLEDVRSEVPELRVYRELSIPAGEELELEDCIAAAYGHDGGYSFNILSKEECRTTSSIKNALKEGCINVKGLDNIRNEPGSYELIFYAKGTGRLAQTASSKCIVTYYEE